MTPMPISYPFYCIDVLNIIDVIRFFNNQPDVVYGAAILFRGINLYFFKYKMHVFSAIIEKGFRM